MSGTHFCERLSRPQGHNAAGRIMSVTSPGIEPATFRLVAPCLNQQRLYKLSCIINTAKGCRRLLRLRNCFQLQTTSVNSSYVVLQAAYFLVDTGPEGPPQVEFCASLEWVCICTRKYSWKPNTNTVELDRLHHDRNGVCFIAQQCSSITFVSICFHSRKERLSAHFENVIIFIFIFFFKIS
jgi:hypothetical protein